MLRHRLTKLFGASMLLLTVAPSSRVEFVRDARARQATGSVSGIVFDSLIMRPVEGATVTLFRDSRTTHSDKLGRFRFDSVAAGSEEIAFSAYELDSLGLGTLGAHAVIASGRTATVTLATPSLHTLWAYHCTANNIVGNDSALVWGSVREARGDSLFRGAAAGFQWLSVKPRVTKGVEIQQVQKQVTTDANGDYFACGLPVNIPIFSGAIGGRAASGRVDYTIDGRRMKRVDFMVSDEMMDVEVEANDSTHAMPGGVPASAPGRASNDSASVSRSLPDVRDSTSARVIARDVRESRLSTRVAGTARVRGTVFDDRKVALANATVTVDGGSAPVTTDASGHFSLGQLPAGTHTLSVRQIGRLQVDQFVQLRPGITTDVAVVMSSANALAAVNVLAKSANRLGYDERRERKFGVALDSTILNHRSDLTELLKQVPSIRVAKGDLFTGVFVRPLTRINSPAKCDGNVFLDALPVPFDAIQYVAPSELRAIEIIPYEQVPKEFFTLPGCGAVLVWTKKYKW